jgi:hypothetical protein
MRLQELISLYTGTSIIARGMKLPANIKYRVYRSTGDGCIPAGEQYLHTDRDVEPNRTIITE